MYNESIKFIQDCKTCGEDVVLDDYTWKSFHVRLYLQLSTVAQRGRMVASCWVRLSIAEASAEIFRCNL